MTSLGNKMGKIKLSDTMQFLSGKFNTIAGGGVDLVLEMPEHKISIGGELRASARVKWPRKAGKIDYLQISLKGQVQRDGKWEKYIQSAEVAHEKELPENHEFVVPIIIVIPEDAVLTEDGANWSLFARAFINKQFDPRAELDFQVIP